MFEQTLMCLYRHTDLFTNVPNL